MSPPIRSAAARRLRDCTPSSVVIGDSAGVHVVTLSFDDGFASSSLRTAEIFERHGLVAELNIVATGHHTEPDDAWHQGWRKGDFSLWNELKRRGHHVMPHGTVTRTRRNCRSRMHSG